MQKQRQNITKNQTHSSENVLDWKWVKKNLPVSKEKLCKTFGKPGELLPTIELSPL